MDPKQKRQFKDAIYEQFARIGKALANRRRLELLDLLAQTERSVEELANETGTSVANASQHLQILRRARLVETRQEGTYVYYRLGDKSVLQLWQALRGLGEARLAEVERITKDYLQHRERLEAVQIDELFRRMKEDRVIVLDVRPAEEYDAGHITGARSIPHDELEARLEEIPTDAEVVAYCRGPYCVFSDDVVDRLRRHGLQALRLSAGFPDWEAAGLPIERGRGQAL